MPLAPDWPSDQLPPRSGPAFTEPLGLSLSDKGSSPFPPGPFTSSRRRLPKNIPNKKTPDFFFPPVHIPRKADKPISLGIKKFLNTIV